MKQKQKKIEIPFGPSNGSSLEIVVGESILDALETDVCLAQSTDIFDTNPTLLPSETILSYLMV